MHNRKAWGFLPLLSQVNSHYYRRQVTKCLQRYKTLHSRSRRAIKWINSRVDQHMYSNQTEFPKFWCGNQYKTNKKLYRHRQTGQSRSIWGWELENQPILTFSTVRRSPAHYRPLQSIVVTIARKKNNKFSSNVGSWLSAREETRWWAQRSKTSPQIFHCSPTSL